MKQVFNHIGVTNAKGEFKVVNIAKLNNALSAYPNSRFTITIEKVPADPGPAMLSYLYSYLIPMFKQAFRDHVGEALTMKGTEQRLASMVSVCIEERATAEGISFVGTKEFRELGKDDIKQAIAELHLIGSMHFGLVFDKFK